MPRCVLFVVMVAALAGCDRYSHTAYWSGVRAVGGSWSGRGASYRGVDWHRRDPTYVDAEILGDAPRFSIRLPDGSVLTPDQFTVELLDAKARPRPVNFTYPSGKLTVWFDELGQLRSIEADTYDDSYPSGSSEGDVAVGNRDGTKLVQLPATRAQLVDIFGEPPPAEDSKDPNLYWPGVMARAAHPHPDAEPLYKNVRWGSMTPRIVRSGGPGFSVRLPDGSVLTPDQLTVEALDARAPPPENRGSRVFLKYPNGRLVADFDRFDQLTSVEFRADWKPGRVAGGDFAVGNREGTKLVALPATLDELVELFGEPTLEGRGKITFIPLR